MNDRWKDALPLDTMQYMRIQEHPIQIEEPLIVIDNLEAGTLKLYEHTGEKALQIQQLIYRNCNDKNVTLVAEAVINSHWKDEGVFIHKISCEDGYEYLAEPMIYQILHFADFYEIYQSVGILDREYEHWYSHAKGALTDFKKVNRVYEYQLPGGGWSE